MTRGYVRHREGDIHDTQAVAWREGRWIICALAGKVVARRYTRTKPRTARFRFNMFNSGERRSLDRFWRVEFTDREPANNSYFGSDKRIDTPIRDRKPEPCADLPF